MRTPGRIALSTLVLLTLVSTVSIAAVKLRHVLSIYADSQEKALKRPEGVACSDKELVIADTGNGRLVRYTLQNDMLEGGQALAIEQLSYPVRVLMDARGDILALDEKQRRIVRMSQEGRFKGYLEPAGVPGGASLRPRSFAIDANGDIYILDVFGGRVVVLNGEEKFVRAMDFPDHAGFISDIAVDKAGTLFLLDSVLSTVYSAAPEAKKFTAITQSMKENVLFPTSMTTDGRGTLYLIDQNGSDIVILGQDGSFQGRQSTMGWKEGQLRYPSQACMTPDGDLVVADRDNNRVQIFSTAQ